MSHPKIIIYADAANYERAVSAARFVQQPGYVWPDDGLTIIRSEPWGGGQAVTMAVKRNKSSITVWDQAAPTVVAPDLRVLPWGERL